MKLIASGIFASATRLSGSYADYPHRPQSGHIKCYLNRTYHVLPTHCPHSLLDHAPRAS